MTTCRYDGWTVSDLKGCACKAEREARDRAEAELKSERWRREMVEIEGRRLKERVKELERSAEMGAIYREMAEAERDRLAERVEELEAELKSKQEQGVASARTLLSKALDLLPAEDDD